MSSKLTKPLPLAADLRARFAYDPEGGVLSLHSDGSFVGWDRGNGYLCVGFKRQTYMVHRVIWKMIRNEDPECVDHLNGDTKDNRLANLRSTTHDENKRNQKLNARNKSGHMGVFRHGNAWKAHIHVEGKLKYLGHSVSFEGALALRLSAEKQFGYHENHGSR